jgi:hypothetical protein
MKLYQRCKWERFPNLSRSSEKEARYCLFQVLVPKDGRGYLAANLLISIRLSRKFLVIEFLRRNMETTKLRTRPAGNSGGFPDEILESPQIVNFSIVLPVCKAWMLMKQKETHTQVSLTGPLRLLCASSRRS